ncbi:peptidase C39 family protein [soil metagenome]
MTRDISFRPWRAGDLSGGTHLGTGAGDRGLAMTAAVGTRRHAATHDDRPPRSYEWSAWVSPVVQPGHQFSSLVPSWNARTPQESWLEVEVRTSVDGLRWSRWYSLGCWAESSEGILRTTRGGQGDHDALVSIDVLRARTGVLWTGYQLRLALHRKPGSQAEPEVSLVGAAVSGPAPAHPGDGAGDGPFASARGVELAVPAYSQQIHRGEYLQWGGGGEAWCSPAATAMVLGTWGLGPSEEEYSWVEPSYPDRFVDHAAAHVFDHAYGGAGNWSFNVAYAARYGTEAFVTQLRSLAEAELFVAAGIPLVASVSFAAAELEGAGYDTSGHLVAIVGFDQDGGVICNDPASHELAGNDQVRVVYDRRQFDNAWRSGGDGFVYVIHPPDVALPDPALPGQPNW